MTQNSGSNTRAGVLATDTIALQHTQCIYQQTELCYVQNLDTTTTTITKYYINYNS